MKSSKKKSKKQEDHKVADPVFNPDKKSWAQHQVAQKARKPQQTLKEWPEKVHRIENQLKVEDIYDAGSTW